MDNNVSEQFKQLKTRTDVANILGIDEKSLRYFLYAVKPDNMYIEFTIEKRRGGARSISAPDRRLKNIQRKLLRILENVYNPKVCAYGFINGKSICDNANKHLKRNQLLNIDLKDYFTQINFGRVRGMLLKKPYELGEEAATTLAQLMCYKGRLPQGAPTSPIVANMICAPMDNHFMKLAKDYQLHYTRYADDITISTKGTFPTDIAYEKNNTVIIGSKILDILRRDGFELNEEKIHLRSKDERQEVTGLIVNKKVNVRREYIKEVRAILHNYEKNGVDNAILSYITKYKKKINVEDEKNKLSDSQKREQVINWFIEILKGKISFIKDVRGENDLVYIKYAKQLNEVTKKNIFKMDKYDEFMLKIEKSVFVLESQNTFVQGTGFLLKDIGLMTNYHVTEDNDFYNVSTCKKEKVIVVSNITNLIKNSKEIDYACYDMKNIGEWESWECGDSDSLRIGTELKMISYPDYINEECANIQNVQITGRRTYLGNEIITISGRVIHGASGGLILDNNQKVVGVINCGPATIEETEDTIIQGFIPINSIMQDINNKNNIIEN